MPRTTGQSIHREPTTQLPIKVFDFFSGCGGTCVGFRRAGLDVVFALDIDADARASFGAYPGFKSLVPESSPIQDLDPQTLAPLVSEQRNHPLLFSACAPCQPFTKQHTLRRVNDERVTLLLQFLRFVEAFTPEFVFAENVPGIQKVNANEGPLGAFMVSLERLGYYRTCGVVASQDYGVPQQRRRFVLLASRIGHIDLPTPTHGPRSPRRTPYRTVRDTIADLPAIHAGEQHPADPMHRAANLSPLNLRRIRALSEGAARTDWPEGLWLNCHRNGYGGHTDVYGRMRWDMPASGLTTKCISLSNGRFGHPEQDRAISIREAALLQTFPPTFQFSGSLQSRARQVGNAVPPRLAELVGRHFARHFKEHSCG